MRIILENKGLCIFNNQLNVQRILTNCPYSLRTKQENCGTVVFIIPNNTVVFLSCM